MRLEKLFKIKHVSAGPIDLASQREVKFIRRHDRPQELLEKKRSLTWTRENVVNQEISFPSASLDNAIAGGQGQGYQKQVTWE